MFRAQDLAAADFAQWLYDGWGFIRISPDTAPELTYFHGVNGESFHARVRGYTAPNTFRDHDIDLREAEVYCHWPLCGAVNVPIDDYSVGMILERTTERQFRRTYYGRYVDKTCPRMWEVIKKHGRAVESLTTSCSNVVWGAFYPEYPSARSALNKILSGQAVSVAISPTILLIGSPKRVLVYDKQKHVGFIENGRAVLTHSDAFVVKRIEKQLNAKLEQAQ